MVASQSAATPGLLHWFCVDFLICILIEVNFFSIIDIYHFTFQTFLESVTYTPFAMLSFYFCMSLLELKPFNEAVAEVRTKFLPTYKVSIIYTINNEIKKQTIIFLLTHMYNCFRLEYLLGLS